MGTIAAIPKDNRGNIFFQLRIIGESNCVDIVMLMRHNHLLNTPDV